MTTPCTTCKYVHKREDGHRTFLSCTLEKNGFVYDDWTYRHSCTTFEPIDDVKQELKGGNNEQD